MRRAGLMLTLVLLVVPALSSVASGDPPRPGTTDSNLTESEEATLWSKQPAAAYVSNEAYRDAYGDNRTTIHEIANGTDLTFAEPPSTAQRWTRYAHGRFEPGSHDVSRYESAGRLTRCLRAVGYIDGPTGDPYEQRHSSGRHCGRWADCPNGGTDN